MSKLKFCFIFFIYAISILTVIEAEEQKQFSINVYGSGSLPIGEYRSFSLAGGGLGVVGGINLFPEGSVLAPLELQAEIAGLFNATAQDKFTSLINLQWALGGSYIIPLNALISVGGGVSYGGIYHFLGVDSIIEGELDFSFYDQSINLQGEIVLNLSSSFQVVFNPGYQFFFETEYLGQQTYLKAGACFIVN